MLPYSYIGLRSKFTYIFFISFYIGGQKIFNRYSIPTRDQKVDHEIENPNQQHLQIQIWKPYSIDYVDLPQYIKTKGSNSKNLYSNLTKFLNIIKKFSDIVT